MAIASTISTPPKLQGAELRYLTFEQTLAADLASGVLKMACGADEELQFVDASQADDRRVYFAVSNLELNRVSSSGTLSYQVQNGSDSFREASQDFTTLTVFDSKTLVQQVHDRYLSLDTWARRIMAGLDGNLPVNYTRKVALRGKDTKRTYTVYYKYGRTAFAERIGRAFMNRLGVATPPLFPSSAAHAYWVTGVEGMSLTHKLNEWANGSGSFSTWLAEGGWRGHSFLEAVGRATVALYLSGGTDFFHDNMLVTPEYGFTVIDLECTGNPISDNRRAPAKSVVRAINEALRGLFNHGAYVGLNYDQTQSLERGVLQAFSRCLDSMCTVAHPPVAVPEEFYSRGLIQNTAAYGDPLALDYKVPHYAFLVSGEKFVASVQRRLNLLREFNQRYKMQWDNHPFVHIQPR